MSATAEIPTPPHRTAPSFLAAVRRLLWDAGHRSSNSSDPSTPPSDPVQRKRPRADDDESAFSGAASIGGLMSPPHLTRSGKKSPRRAAAASTAAPPVAEGRIRSGTLAASLVSSDEESDAAAARAAKRARTASGAIVTARTSKPSAAAASSSRPEGCGGLRGRDDDAAAASSSRPEGYDFPLSLCSPCEAVVVVVAEASPLLGMLPPEVISADILTFLPTSRDRRALQLTCKQVKAATDAPYFLARLDIGGAGVEGKRGILLEGDNPETAVRKLLPFSRSGNMQAIYIVDFPTVAGGKRGLLLEGDTPEVAVQKLLPFSRAGNMQAVYMLGMLKAYCFDSPKHGVALLRMCASQGYVRAAYALGLILRDRSRSQSRHWLTQAARGHYLPAYQELLPANEVKARFGDLDAERLRGFLDFPCLNRLLGRRYVDSNPRCVQTSHCWNPLCGRWAYKATPSVERYLRRREERARVRAEETGPGDAAVDDSFTRASLMSLLRRDGRGEEDGAEEGEGGCAHSLRGAATAQVLVRGQQGQQRPAAPNPMPLPQQFQHGPFDIARSHSNNNATGGAAGNGEESDDSDAATSAAVLRVSRMKMCSSCRRAKYCSKLCQVYDWRSGRHKSECHFLGP